MLDDLFTKESSPGPKTVKKISASNYAELIFELFYWLKNLK